MAELTTLARPYAKAAFEYARDSQHLADWSTQLQVAAAVTGDGRIQAILQDPERDGEELAALLADVCGDALDKDVRNFLSVLAQNKRLRLLPQITALFAGYKAKFEKSVDVEVVSAFDLADDMTAKLASALSKRLEREVHVHTSTDPDLLGGVLIRAGDLVIDGSVRGRLNKLAAAMNL
ncbi:MAG: F0F1 ATP synthase subunit delta [Haliea sp.]|mgnify:CR=1 FL=1|jgi:F-type H+-transporting ATPase subunit delta|nr:F0F1 ATP synthase subunit delta [Haliea sp.]MDP4789605.1 F0F1 ATP synthase subunit delta [Haliea sp.]MDP4917547.1 F0F1 ATP synthase subunit delta [Haliea sp.]